jgi:phosphopantothenate---cysteine ligase (ATP)
VRLPRHPLSRQSLGFLIKLLATFVRVRFLDNFSAGAIKVWWRCSHLSKHMTGTRGATSAEYFLKSGYAVVFMHRQFSLQPFSRHYSHSTNPFLDLLTIQDTRSEGPNITITTDARAHLLSVLASYQATQREEMLLTLTFVTINDYLWLLRAVSKEMAILGRGAMYYLAAAVSDFFVPAQKLVRYPGR